jgi:hypothetical protein
MTGSGMKPAYPNDPGGLQIYWSFPNGNFYITQRVPQRNEIKDNIELHVQGSKKRPESIKL